MRPSSEVSFEIRRADVLGMSCWHAHDHAAVLHYRLTSATIVDETLFKTLEIMLDMYFGFIQAVNYPTSPHPAA